MTNDTTGAQFFGRPDTTSVGRILAHRGASRISPENTLAAFRIASELGAHWIEFDVSILGDGTPVIHHDDTLDRCTDSTGPLARLVSTDLTGIDTGSWFGTQFANEPLATLEQALDLISEIGLSANLEMKTHGGASGPMARAVAQALVAHPWTRARILVSSFDRDALAALRILLPEQPLAMLYRNPPADWPEILTTLGACSLHIWHERLTPDILSQARMHGFHVRVFTVNEPDLMEHFRETGLTGVITNHPPLFLDIPVWADWAAEETDG